MSWIPVLLYERGIIEGIFAPIQVSVWTAAVFSFCRRRSVVSCSPRPSVVKNSPRCIISDGLNIMAAMRCPKPDGGWWTVVNAAM